MKRIKLIMISSLVVVLYLAGIASAQESQKAGTPWVREALKQQSKLLFKKQNKTRSYFDAKSIQAGTFVQSKKEWRKGFIKNHPPIQGRSMVAPADAKALVEDFVDVYPIVDRLEDIESRSLMKGQSDINPWSDHYWPIYSGGVGLRYADLQFPNDEDWKKNRDYILNLPFTGIFQKKDERQLEMLSPSEKYDLLLNTDRELLTYLSWEEGKRYYDRDGKVERWMGICHGWAPAAYVMDRPTKSVKVMSSDDQTQLKFFPADIKSLATLLWAKTRTPVRFLGNRCNEKDPPKDDEGRIIADECFDTNPAVWHLAIVNQLGIAKGSFVLDATYDYEVWNQPLLSYEYKYFNPETQEEFDTLAEAKIKMSDFAKDPYKKYRSPNAKFIVGIAMKARYVVETYPEDRGTDDASYDQINAAYYAYDLELGENGKLLGGEWYSDAHPDFLWSPTEDARALSVGDRQILHDPDWDGKKSLSQKWKRAAFQSLRKGQPLGRLVESLVNMSK